METSPRVAVLSRRAAERRVWQASQYEFEDVIAAVDSAHILAPARLERGSPQSRIHDVKNRFGKLVGRPRRAPMIPPSELDETELFFAVLADATEIDGLPIVRRQIQSARRKVAFLVELYETQLEASTDYLRQLRGFDHIFVFTRRVIAPVSDITGVPCSFLATGVDADVFVPEEPAPPRSIDVLSYGRRLAGTHAALGDAAARGRLHYSYDTVAGAFDVSDHRDHRAALASNLQRSRYTVVYKNNDEPSRVKKTGGEETLTNRFFEATAAGSVVLGSIPETGDFPDCFDWPDAVVPISAPEPNIEAVIGELDAEPWRLEAARRAGMLAALRCHDWGYRWRAILDAVGLRELPELTERLDRLEERAHRLEREASTSRMR